MEARGEVVNELKDKGDPHPVYMKEHVEEYYLDHFKKQVKDGIFGLRNKCYNALLKGTAPKPIRWSRPRARACGVVGSGPSSVGCNDTLPLTPGCRVRTRAE